MTKPPQTIRVPERGTVDVPAAQWQVLSRSPDFWGLTERGVVSAEQFRGGRARLSGGCYVGRARVTPELALELHEKVPGSLAALLRFATGTDFRVEPVAGPRSELGPLIALLVAHFVEAVRKYAARGRQFHYEKQSMKGSLVGGRLDATRTIRLWARGLRHLAAFDKNVVSFDLPVNRTVLAALREVEQIGRLVPLPRDTVARVRGMAMLFGDCRSAEVLFGRRSEAARRAEALAGAATDRTTADVLALAAVLLAHESFEQGSTHAGTAPRAWFLNLESIFEQAVRDTFRKAMHSVGSVSAGRSAPQPIFPSNLRTFRANPDLVLRHNTSNAVCIGDVKYKSWSGAPKASDVYQLLVHAAAFGAGTAFLVFPSDAFFSRPLGKSVTGTQAGLYGVNIQVLDADVGRILADLGMLPTSSAAVSPNPSP